MAATIGPADAFLFAYSRIAAASRLDRRGVRRIFGWVRVPHPTTFGRRLRDSGGAMVPLLDAVLRRMVRQRRAMAGGAPKKVTVMMDSTVVVRYGKKQAGALRTSSTARRRSGSPGRCGSCRASRDRHSSQNLPQVLTE